MSRLNAEIVHCDALLAGGLFARDAAQAAAVSKQRATAAAALAELEDEWLTDSATYEAGFA